VLKSARFVGKFSVYPGCVSFCSWLLEEWVVLCWSMVVLGLVVFGWLSGRYGKIAVCCWVWKVYVDSF